MNDTLNKYSYSLVTWDGESVESSYRLPTLRRLPEYLDLVGVGKEAECAAFILEEKIDKLEQFTDDSIYALLDKVAEQMDPRVAAWINRQAAKIRKINETAKVLGVDQEPNTGTDSSQNSYLARDEPSKKVKIGQSPK